MKVAIWGYGSIGKRHAANFQQSSFEVGIISSHATDISNQFNNVRECLTKFQPDIIFICNETSKHFDSLKALNDNSFKGIVIVEKPLFDKDYTFENYSFKKLIVSYQLRFHPIIQKFKNSIGAQKILTMNFFVGQYLPTWRPSRDYREIYSAKKSEGGGVLRDLSHEIDLALYFAGHYKRIVSIGGKISDLEITSDDVYSIMSEHDNAKQCQIHLNYLNRPLERYIIINTLDHTYKADLVKKSFTIDGETSFFEEDNNQPYLNMIEKIKNEEWSEFSDLKQGSHIMKVITAAENSNSTESWVKIL